MRPSGTHLFKKICPSIGPSVHPSVCYACAKTGCFWPRWDPIPKQMINQHVLRASFTTQSFYPSDCLSVSLYMSHDQYTQSHSLDASLPGWACFFLKEKKFYYMPLFFSKWLKLSKCKKMFPFGYQNSQGEIERDGKKEGISLFLQISIKKKIDYLFYCDKISYFQFHWSSNCKRH